MAVNVTPYDSADYLDSEEAINEYLAAAFETEDPAFIAQCVGTVVRARNMSKLSREIGMSRPALYKALSGEGNPAFSTMLKILHALGVKLYPTLANGSSK